MSVHVLFVSVARFLVIYGLMPIGIPVYLLFMYMIYKYRNHHQFKSSFFTLISSCGVADLLFITHYFLLFRLPGEGLFMPLFLHFGNPLAKFISVGHMFWQLTQTLGVLIMSANRFTALVKPQRHNQLWSRYNTSLAITAQYLLSFALMAPEFISCEYMFVMRGKGLGVQLTHHSTTGRCMFLSYGVVSVVCSCSTLVVVFMYVCMFYKVWKRGRKVAPQTGGAVRERLMRRVQINLAVGGAVIGFALLLISMHKAVGLFPDAVSPYIYYPIGAILTNLYSLITPFALLATCRKVRKYFVITVKGCFCVKPTAAQLAQLNGGTSNRAAKRGVVRVHPVA